VRSDAVLVGVPVDIRRDVLRAEDDGGRDVDERFHSDDHRLHRRALRRHLSSDASQDHVQSVAGRENDRRRLDRLNTWISIDSFRVESYSPCFYVIVVWIVSTSSVSQQTCAV